VWTSPLWLNKPKPGHGYLRKGFCGDITLDIIVHGGISRYDSFPWINKTGVNRFNTSLEDFDLARQQWGRSLNAALKSIYRLILALCYCRYTWIHIICRGIAAEIEHDCKALVLGAELGTDGSSNSLCQ
jgi:hypothetical protein